MRKRSHQKDSMVCFVGPARVEQTFGWKRGRGVVEVWSCSGHVNCGTQLTQGSRNSVFTALGSTEMEESSQGRAGLEVVPSFCRATLSTLDPGKHRTGI